MVTVSYSQSMPTPALGHDLLLPLNPRSSNLLQFRSWGRCYSEQNSWVFFPSQLSVSVSQQQFSSLMKLQEMPCVLSSMQQCFCWLFRWCGCICSTRPILCSSKAIKQKNWGPSPLSNRSFLVSCLKYNTPFIHASNMFWQPKASTQDKQEEAMQKADW